jgi:hypothetical protein
MTKASFKDPFAERSGISRGVRPRSQMASSRGWRLPTPTVGRLSIPEPPGLTLGSLLGPTIQITRRSRLLFVSGSSPCLCGSFCRSAPR